MKPDLSELSVTILSYNRCDELLQTFVPLCHAAQYEGFELIIVDNASSDGSLEIIKHALNGFPFVKFVSNPSNLGVGRGRNAGWSISTRSFILNLDDDTRVEVQDLLDLVHSIKRFPSAGVVFPQVRDVRTGKQLAPFGPNAASPGNFLGGCHIVRRSAVQEVGLLDDECSFGGEELDYSIRMRAHGWDVVFDPDCTVPHNGLPRQPREDKWRRREWNRNFIRVHFKHFPWRVASVFAFRFSVSQLLSGVRAHGLSFIPGLLRSSLVGAKQGWAIRHVVKPEVVQFYRRYGTRPDVGNVPLSFKLWTLLSEPYNRRR